MSDNKNLKQDTKSYRVRITERLVMYVDVEANSKEEAEQIATDNWHNGDYLIDSENFDGVDVETVAS